MTIWPIRPLAFHVRSKPDVTDIAFTTRHPALWPFEDEAEIICNSPVDGMQLAERILARDEPWISHAHVAGFRSPDITHAPPFSLGPVPCSMFGIVRHELEAMGVRLFIPRVPEERASLVALVIDGEDYIVAEDFEVDVPELEHRTEWFDASR